MFIAETLIPFNMRSSRDRHKVTCVFQRGAEKQKITKEQAEKDAQVLAKTRWMTDFITSQPRAPKSGTYAVCDASSKSSMESKGLCAPGVADEVADSATATHEKESADNPHKCRG